VSTGPGDSVQRRSGRRPFLASHIVPDVELLAVAVKLEFTAMAVLGMADRQSASRQKHERSWMDKTEERLARLRGESGEVIIVNGEYLIL